MKKELIKKIVKFSLIGLAGLLVLAYIIGSKSKFVIKSDPVKASSDQKNLIDGFGYPDTFALAMDKKDRIEVWNYYGLERSFTFNNGVFINDQIIDSLASFEAYPKWRPTQFKNSLSLEDINGMFETTPTIQADIDPEIIDSSQTYNYSDQVIIGVKDNRVVFVQTLPVNTE